MQVSCIGCSSHALSGSQRQSAASKLDMLGCIGLSARMPADRMGSAYRSPQAGCRGLVASHLAASIGNSV